LENIPSRDPWTSEIHLVDVDASIGHVLIHFLHTGVYQTLNDEGIKDIENTHSNIVRTEFQKAVLALEAAKKYSVPGLQELAQLELERHGKEMCLRDAVRAIREAFIVGPPDEHAWLRDYVSKKVQWTFKHDPSTLSAPDFFESIESPTLTKILAQIIVGLYSEEVDKLRREKVATSKSTMHERSEPPRLPSKRTAAISTAWPASVKEFGAFDDSVAAWGPQDLGQDQGSRSKASTPAALSSCSKGEKEKEALQLSEEAVEASADDLQHPRSETDLSSADRVTKHDGTDVQASKEPLADLSKEQQIKGEKKEGEAAPKGIEDAESRRSKEGVAGIQILQAEQSTIAQPQERVVAATSSTTSKDEFEAQPNSVSRDSHSFIPKKKKKAKMKTGYTLPETPHTSLPLMAPAPPASPPGIQLEVDPTLVVDVATVTATAPAAQEDLELEPGPYAGLSKSQVKKLKAKLDREARLKKVEVAAKIRRQEEEKAEQIRLEEEEAELKKTKEEEGAAAAAAADVSA
jgi:hypothetical protein